MTGWGERLAERLTLLGLGICAITLSAVAFVGFLLGIPLPYHPLLFIGGLLGAASCGLVIADR